MIRPLRRRHLWLIGLVALIAAPLYLAALAARPAPAVQEALPDALVEPAATASGEGIELPTSPPLRLRAVAGSRVEAVADGFVEGADLLLYWAPAGSSRALDDAYLLGSVHGGERQLFNIPEAATAAPGVLVLYSLAHGEEVAYAPWPPGTGKGP